MQKRLFLLTILTLGNWAYAGDGHHHHGHSDSHKRAHKAHVHGHGKIRVAVEGTHLHVEMELPAEDIVGFERRPRSAEEKAKVEKAKLDLMDPAKNLTVPKTCQLKEKEVHSELLQKSSKKLEHSEFEVKYHFECQDIQKIKGFTLLFFDRYSLQQLEAIVLTPKRQRKQKITPKSSFIQIQ